MKKEILTRPFAREQIKQRKGNQGKTVNYVDIGAVIERLNEAFDHRWDFEVLRHEVRESEVVVLGKLTGDGITKSAFGCSSVTVDHDGVVVSIGDDLKAAASDALKKAASLLGVALEIYSGQAGTAPDTGDARRAGQQPPRHPTAIADRLTSRQLAAIHAACRSHGVTREELETLLDQRTGKDRPEQLTRAEASDIISTVSAMGSNGAHA